MKIENLLAIEKFCWCIDLRYGALIIGYLELILSLISLALNIERIVSLHFISTIVIVVQDAMFLYGIHSVNAHNHSN